MAGAGVSQPRRQALDGASEDVLDMLRQQLAIGVHRNVEVTDSGAGGRRVSQEFCSALPVSYSGLSRRE